MPGTFTWFAASTILIFSLLFAYQCPRGSCLFDDGRLAANPEASARLSRSRSELHDVFYHLGGNSPWIVKKRNVINETIDPAQGCRVDQVHMLGRHAERYPTLRSGILMLQLYQRLVSLNVTFTGPLEFVNDWNFFMSDPAGKLESLVSTGVHAGTLEAFNTGVKIRTRYEDLLNQAIDQGQTRLWASDSGRVKDTAAYFATGLYGLGWRTTADLQVIAEGPERGADTLTPGRTCTAYRDNTDPDGGGHDLGYGKLADWQATYLPAIRQRLAPFAPDVTFTLPELYTMQEICGYELISKDYSPWCDVFAEDEWESFEYARDLLHFYRSGPGNPYSMTLGSLFLNATTRLLQQGPDAGPLFFSFVHDGDIVPFLAALDLLPQAPSLLSTERMDNRTWRTSDVVPMGGRIILERWSCPIEQHCWSNAPYYPNHVYCEPKRSDHFVRIQVNDGYMALPGCRGGPGQSCPLTDFVKHVRQRVATAGNFRQKCGLSDDMPRDLIFLRQPQWTPKEPEADEGWIPG